MSQLYPTFSGDASFNETAYLNTSAYDTYFNRLKNLAMSLFKWENLPKSCNERFLELTLFDYGNAAFVFDEELGFLNLKVTPSRELNIYELPTYYNCYSIGYNKEYDIDDCVLIRNNYLSIPTSLTISQYAYRVALLQRAMDVNTNAQRTPIIIKCDEKEKQSFLNFYKDYDGNKPFIFGMKGLNLENVSVLNTQAPYIADKLYNDKIKIWNEALTFLGINNFNIEKKERLITDEVKSNNEIVEMSVETMLLTRQEACEQINERYDLDISVSLRKNDIKMGVDIE